jgi:hypothetical protein
MHWIGTTARILVITLLVWLAADQLLRVFNIGSVMPTHYDRQNEQRTPAPYIAFKGAPDRLDHDHFGYRWVPEAEDPDAIKIAFFGGSTGYQGDPPIPSLLESRLNAGGRSRVQVANFSVVSSNHRQHLHNIIESRSLFRPDVVIFYGGYNETLQPAGYDPRPGYPYNFFYRNETPPLNQWLIRYSPTFFLIDKLLTGHGIDGLTPLAALRRQQQPFSAHWDRAIIRNYFDTLELARTVSGAFPSPHCGKTLFLFFYQPYQVPAKFLPVHNEIRSSIGRYSYGYDLSDTFRKRGLDVFTDIVHVTQPGREAISAEMAGRLLTNAEFLHCKL